jgi:hypothetical protein
MAVIEGRARAARQRREDDIALAWHVEAFARQKTLDPLGKILGAMRRPERKQQTTEEMVEAFRGMAGDKMSIRFIPKESVDGVPAVEPGGGEGA